MLSIIIPHYHEHPQLLFTLQSLLFQLEGSEIERDLDFEIILVDNADHYQSDHRELDTSRYIKMKQDAGLLPKVKSLKYIESLSHWQAKNYACQQANPFGTFLFLDAHVLLNNNSINDMCTLYKVLPKKSTLHLPICYMLEPEAHKLAYELVYDLSKGTVDYKFTPWTSLEEITEVPCMSTCGMMLSKEVYFNTYGGWPKELGNYSGGEHYINFVGALLGVKKYIANVGPVYHYAAPRAYNINYNDVYRNRAIAMFLVGGESFLSKYCDYLRTLLVGKISPRMINKIQCEIPSSKELKERRNIIQNDSVMSIESWIQIWT